MSDPTREARTEAGRSLFARFWATNDYTGASMVIAGLMHDIVAIEEEAAALSTTPAPDEWTDLAADIRAIDGNHDLGAGALAEALIERGWTRRSTPMSEQTREARNIAVCGKDDCTPVEHWERVAMRAIRALSTTPAPLDVRRVIAFTILSLRQRNRLLVTPEDQRVAVEAVLAEWEGAPHE